MWEIIRGILMIFYLPFAYGKHLFDKLRNVKEREPREHNIWQNYVKFDTYTLELLVLGDEESIELLESKTLDFPNWKDWGDPFRSLIKYRSQPEIEELNKAVFDEIDLKTKLGIYLIRINEKGKGMTLCLLPSNKPEIIDIVELKPLSWNMGITKSGTIELLGFADKGQYKMNIKPTTTPKHL